MAKYNSKSSKQSYIYLALILLTFGAWYLTAVWELDRLKLLKVHELPPAKNLAKPVDVKTLYPVLVEFKKPVVDPVGVDSSQLDSIFKTTLVETKKPTDIPAIDYRALLKQSMTLTGVSREGAFINNVFYKKSEVISGSVIVDGKTKIVPVLAQVGKSDAVVRYGRGGTIVLKLPQ